MNRTTRVEELHDILVVGGGPAGATIAIRLAQLGYKVIVVEARADPRPGIGISLPPAIEAVFNQLGLSEEIARARFARTSGAVLRWGGEVSKPDWSGPLGYQVDRAIFDRLLLQGAVGAGASVLQPARAVSASQLPSGRWSVKLEIDERRRILHPKTLIVATGRRNIFAGRVERHSQPTLALYAYWKNVEFSATCSHVEAGRHGWCWAAPLPGGRAAVAVFMDPASSRGRKALSIKDRYLGAIARYSILAPLSNAALASSVTGCNASRQLTGAVAEDHFLRVGEAAFALDPLSAQGVMSAMISAMQGAAIVHTWHARPRDSEWASEFARDRQIEAIKRDAKIGGAYYARQKKITPSEFWRRRVADIFPSDIDPQSPQLAVASPHARLRLSRNTTIARTPTLSGDFVEVAPALVGNHLPRPIAFIHDVPIARLIAPLESKPTAVELLQAWSRLLPGGYESTLFRQLWRAKILVSGA